MTGGIPSFLAMLASDRGLRADVEVMNTTPAGDKRPGVFSAGNVGQGMRDAWRLLRRAGRFDVVHLNVAAAPTLPLFRAMVLAGAARMAGARVLVHAHTGRLERSARRRGYRALLRLTGRLAVLVVVSRAAEETARPLVRQVVRVQNGIDASAYPTGPKDEPPTVAFVGTVCERKGLLDLRDALRSIEGVPMRTVIMGDARQEGPGVFEGIRDAYRGEGLEGVEFTGSLDHPEVVSRLSRSAVFCLPSYWEGFPLSVLEAMASGCAVVATAVGDVPEILDRGTAGVLVAPRDVEALAAALRRLLTNPGERARLGAAARRRVETYGRREVMERLADLYEELAGHSM